MRLTVSPTQAVILRDVLSRAVQATRTNLRRGGPPETQAALRFTLDQMTDLLVQLERRTPEGR